MINKVGLRNGKMISNAVWEVIRAPRQSLVVCGLGRNRYMYFGGRRFNIIGGIR